MLAIGALSLPAWFVTDMECYGDTACFFERLALIETISFEDFEFGSVLGDMLDVTATSLVSARCQWQPADVDKRVVLLNGNHLDEFDNVRMQDILCVQFTAFNNLHPIDAMVASFGALTANHVRVCVLGRCLEGETYRAAQLLEAPHWLEWKAPYEEGSTCSSLIFSRHWRDDVPGHTAKIIRNYMATLSEPEFLSSRVRMDDWVAGAQA